MNWSEFPFLRIALSFALGIFIFEYFDLGLDLPLFTLGTLIFCYLIVENKNYFVTKRMLFNGFILISSCFLLGGILLLIKKRSEDDSNFKTLTAKEIRISGTLTEKLKSGSKLKFVFKSDLLLVTGNYKAKHKVDYIIIFDTSDYAAKNYNVGNNISFKGVFHKIKNNTNPESFDYSKYLQYKSIYQQSFVKKGNHKLISIKGFNSFRMFAENTKQFSSKILNNYIREKELLGIAEAILLGSRLLLSEDVFESFANTGAIHVLAVSGLHVMIFMSFFIWLFDRIKTKSYLWIITKISALLIILWFYVILTGISPSVVRAGFMVSLYVMGKNLQKVTNNYNLLSVAALMMLIYNPYYLFQASFQFSFASLISILFFQPKISKLYKPETKLNKFIWSMINVSLAAQILVFPLSIYYFHKFPLFFALSGIVAIPLTTFIIYTGTLVIILESFLPFLASIISYVLNALLTILAKSISFLANLPFNTVDGIWISDFGLMTLLMFLICTMLWLNKRTLIIFNFALVSIFLFVGDNCWAFYKNKVHQELIVYDTYGGTMIEIYKGGEVETIISGELSERQIKFAALNNRINNGISSTDINIKFSNTNIFSTGTESIYLFSSIEDFNRLQNNICVDYLIVTNERGNAPEKILKKIDPVMVILDRTVPPWIVTKWKNYQKRYMFNLHDIKNQGAYCISSL